MKITIVGNIHSGKPAYDGGTLKIKNVFNALKQLGYNPNIIDVDLWKKRPFSIFRKIRKSLLEDDVFVLMCASRGSRLLLRLTAHIKRKAKYIFCPIGIGTVKLLISKRLSSTEEQEFLACKNFFGIKDSRIKRSLGFVDSVVIENEQLKRLYENYYSLENVHILTNFRTISKPVEHRLFNEESVLNVVFLSRILRTKGILDLLEVVDEINRGGSLIKLDIYGQNYLDETDNAHFKGKLSNLVTYYGPIDNSEVIPTLSKYDLYCFPVNSHEGTPGSLIESILAGTPCLASSIGQISEFVSDGYDGFVYEFGSKEDLKAKLLYAYDHRELLPLMADRLQQKRKSFSFEGNKEALISAFCLN